MIDITIRLGMPEDAATLAFFNVAMARETENKVLDGKTVESGVRYLLDNPQYGFYIVAETATGIIVGSCMITYEWSDWRNGVFWWFQSVYVAPDYRRRGILRSMFRFVKQKAETEDIVCGFRLYVEKNNLTAQKAYSNLGLDCSSYLIFEETRK